MTNPRVAAAMVLAGCLLGAGPAPAANEALGPMRFTVATTAQASNGVHWAYLLWQATDTDLLQGEAFAVHAKPGDAGAPGPFAPVGVTGPAQDLHTVGLLLSRAAAVGEDLTELEADLDAIFGPLVPDPSLSIEDKIQAIIQAVLVRPELMDTLLMVARMHPGMALCLGQAFATPIESGSTTFEIRDGTGGVMGRVTVEAGAPVVLPAPEALTEIFEESPKGHLNVRLRWSSPPALRRLSLLRFGFHVYRIERAYAEAPARHFHTTPPNGTVMRALADSTPEVRRVNRIPVLVDEDTAAPDAEFFIDDNDQFSPGGEPLRNGDQYYYFITARDVLGRDGDVSAGLLVTVCDRMPPAAPGDIEVRNLYGFEAGEPTQSLEISWSQNDSTSNDVTSMYFVYRWAVFSNITARAADPFYVDEAIYGPFVHLANTTRQSFVDTAFTSNDLNRTIWYTVRALDDGACAPNWSGNSEPAWGVYRDWYGPDAPGGVVYIVDSQPAILAETPQLIATNFTGWQVRSTRLDDDIAWMDYRYGPGASVGLGAASNLLGRFAFAAGSSRVESPPVAWTGAGDAVTLYARAGTLDGRTSPYAAVVLSREANLLTRGAFEVWSTNTTALAGINGDRHTGLLPDQDTLPGITGLVYKSTGAVSWRVFRRINNGEHQLVANGDFADALFKTWQDLASGMNYSATVCYYAQVFDEHGNPSPLVLIGCFTHTGTQPPPRPMLARPRGELRNGAPTLRLRWFCPPHGVERFELGVAASPGGPPTQLAPELSTNLVPQTVIQTVTTSAGKQVSARFGHYTTGRLGTLFGQPNDVNHSVVANIQTGVTYTVWVRTVGQNGKVIGPESNVEQFTWAPTTSSTTPQVPWPARGMPAVATNFHSGLEARVLRAANYSSGMLTNDQAAVRIGEADLAGWPDDSFDILPGTNAPPARFLFRDPQDQTELLPFLLYRYQVPNGDLPHVSGDVIQVSPLMEVIPHVLSGFPMPHLAVRDPFIRVIPRVPRTGMLYDIYLLDTQPVILGASYQYVLVLLNPQGELRQVIPTNVLHVPFTP